MTLLKNCLTDDTPLQFICDFKHDDFRFVLWGLLVDLSLPPTAIINVISAYGPSAVVSELPAFAFEPGMSSKAMTLYVFETIYNNVAFMSRGCRGELLEDRIDKLKEIIELWRAKNLGRLMPDDKYVIINSFDYNAEQLVSAKEKGHTKLAPNPITITCLIDALTAKTIDIDKCMSVLSVLSHSYKEDLDILQYLQKEKMRKIRNLKNQAAALGCHVIID